ncbi:hypothetical protein ACFPES_10315 [Paenibacillus sp. GCM10023248]|uniref:hypothetical protein n=1 Tax=Bacillales TaxID=1385 RepID=UPI002379A60E|nr:MULTISPECIES: hypothetical protein [Bacillales]MDD9267416.1 hypothetical protein [Paenibacillus sp. MAHUQ-63]MDR6882631.1 hypothetical protein [Bacillus sp. 3255]
MSRMIQAYFHTENQAEDARVLLLKFNPEHMEIGALPEGYGGGGRLLLPMVEGGGIVSESSSNNRFGMVNVLPTAAPAAEHYADDGDAAKLRYVLSVKVDDGHYLEAVGLIRRNHGHLEAFE